MVYYNILGIFIIRGVGGFIIRGRGLAVVPSCRDSSRKGHRFAAGEGTRPHAGGQDPVMRNGK